jgi:hypothetical protein
MDRIFELLTDFDIQFGPLHIAASDGNLDDSNIAFCEKEVAANGATDRERELLALLKSMTEDQRYEVWDKLHAME